MENKCPHCGKPMPKSSAFCMHCMQGISEKEAPLPAAKAGGKKRTIIVCALCLAAALSAVISFAAIKRKNAAPPAASVSVTASSATAAVTTQKTSQTAKPTTQTTKKAEKKTTKKETTTQETTASPPAEAVEVPEQPVYQPTQAAQPTTRAVATTQNNQVVINGSVLSDYPNTKQDSFYAVPYSVSSISNYAFHGNPYLRVLKFSKRAYVSCNWSNLFANLPNLETIYLYTGTNADTEGMQYFDGEIVYYYD